MVRKVGWEDESITGGFGGPNKERKYAGKKGEKHIIRCLTDCLEYRVHAINDVLEPKEDGEERVFNMICSKEWDDEAEDWTGECLACDGDYEISEKYICGILLLGVKKGTKGSVQRIDPENSVHYWPFGADKYRKLSNIAMELKEADPPKKLSQVELVISCEDDTFQKLDINVSQAKALTTKAHVAAFKEEGEELVSEASTGPKLSDQKRRLKKKRRGGKAAKRSSKQESSGEDFDGGGEDVDSGNEQLDELLADL